MENEMGLALPLPAESDEVVRDRCSLAYWLIDVAGVSRRTASRVIALDRRGIDPRPHFPGDAEKITAAFESLAEVVNDC